MSEIFSSAGGSRRGKDGHRRDRPISTGGRHLIWQCYIFLKARASLGPCFRHPLSCLDLLDAPLSLILTCLATGVLQILPGRKRRWSALGLGFLRTAKIDCYQFLFYFTLYYVSRVLGMYFMYSKMLPGVR